jgi:hypothetical protein
VVPDLVPAFEDRSPTPNVAAHDARENEERRAHVEALEEVEPSAHL